MKKKETKYLEKLIARNKFLEALKNDRQRIEWDITRGKRLMLREINKYFSHELRDSRFFGEINGVLRKMRFREHALI